MWNGIKDTGRQIKNEGIKQVKENTEVGKSYTNFMKDQNFDTGMKLGKELSEIARVARNTYSDFSGKEYHMPGYAYMGPGTKVQERVAMGIKPANKTDTSAMRHDLTFDEIGKRKKKENLSDRQVRDLVRQADEQFISELESYDDEQDLVGNKVGKAMIRLKTIADSTGMLDPVMFLE